MKPVDARDGDDESGGGAWPPEGWLTNRQTAERLGIGVDTLVSTWKYRDTLKAVARTVGKPGGGRCNLYPVEVVERIAAEREAASRAVVPDGFVDGDGVANMLGVARGTWNGWLSDGTIQIESTAMPGAGSLGRRKLYAVGDVERLRDELRAAGKLFIAPEELGRGKWLTINEAAAVAGVWVKTWDIWSKSGRVPAGVWVKGPMGQPTQMWPEKALDCRRVNIVVKTHGEQSHGSRKRRTTMGGQKPTSRFKGVCWLKGRWKAGIQKDKQAYKIGYFEDEIAAAQAYDEKAIELYGDLARINFPNGVDAWLEREAVEAGVATPEGGTEVPATARAA